MAFSLGLDFGLPFLSLAQAVLVRFGNLNHGVLTQLPYNST
jgi:hypothetical protein